MKPIETAFKCLQDIGNTTKTTEKYEILKRGLSDSPLNLLRIMYQAYNPFLVYGIKKIPKVQPASKATEECNIEIFIELLKNLKDRKLTGNEAINAVTDFLKECNEVEQLWYTRVLKKDLKIGLNVKGINKVAKDLIPVHEVMLADKIPETDLGLENIKTIKMLPEEIIVQPKIDGYRLNIFHFNDGRVQMMSRNGKVIEGYKTLEKEVSEILPKGYIYDGEIVAPELLEWIEQNTQNRVEGTKIANRDLFSETMRHAFSKEKEKSGVFNVFDVVPLNEWETHKTTQPYKERLNFLQEILEETDAESLCVVRSYTGFHKNKRADLDIIVELFHNFLSIGWEGLMIKDANLPYEFKRSKGLLKMKMMDEIDLEVVELFEGDGKYQGQLGGVYVEYKGNKVGVGSGWSDSQRQYYWEHPNELLGKTLSIAYQAETKNQQGLLSLSFPVVKRIRDDK